MDKQRRKELLALYRQMKHPMGIFIIKRNDENKCYIEATQDLKGTMNGTRFKLDAGNHPNQELQKEWSELGDTRFTMEVLEPLDYDKDESKTDYTEDLQVLKELWEDKLRQQNMKFYRKSLKKK
jgi:hypothetical protein